MADTTSVRKSGRQRVLSKKYTVDAFEGLDILDSDSEENATVWPQLQDTKGDDNYSGEIPSEGEGETLAEKVSDGSVILTPLEDYEDAHSCASSNPEMIANTSKTAKRKVKDRESHREPNFYSRGMPENPMKADSSRISTNILSGSGVEDIRHIVKSRDQWAADPILPRRSKMCPSFTYTEEKRHIEATVGWDWYYDHGGRQFFAERQKIRLLSRDEGIKYTRTLTQSSNRFLMGPYKRQTVFDLLTSQSLDLDQAWNAAATTVTDQQSHPNGTYTKKRRRLGWMLNVGARVRCLDWAPNHDGETQFLALATAQPSNSTPKPPPMEAPAYTPSPSSPSSIQIWALPINATLDIANSVEPIQPPELCLLICTEWGHVSQLKWCPVPRDGRGNHADGKVFIGLLAGIWQDGLARVLDVYLERGQHTVKFDSPAFSACMHGMFN